MKTKTIRIPIDSYERLKTLAQPFKDTPASTIGRLLDAHGRSECLECDHSLAGRLVSETLKGE